ncbi:MAG TPA: hypothetical protein VFK05_28295 [Polyangiaceae bacterium]|nr:hypothetical protein [Polyangiaceae bacterium]
MVAFGLLTTALRIWRPGVLSKLAAMQRRWGDRAGFWIHVFAYSVLPVLAGTGITLQGWAGAALF